jgi:hypothetical protein
MKVLKLVICALILTLGVMTCTQPKYNCNLQILALGGVPNTMGGVYYDPDPYMIDYPKTLDPRLITEEGEAWEFVIPGSFFLILRSDSTFTQPFYSGKVNEGQWYTIENYRVVNHPEISDTVIVNILMLNSYLQYYTFEDIYTDGVEYYRCYEKIKVPPTESKAP